MPQHLDVLDLHKSLGGLHPGFEHRGGNLGVKPILIDNHQLVRNLAVELVEYLDEMPGIPAQGLPDQGIGECVGKLGFSDSLRRRTAVGARTPWGGRPGSQGLKWRVWGRSLGRPVVPAWAAVRTARRLDHERPERQ